MVAEHRSSLPARSRRKHPRGVIVRRERPNDAEGIRRVHDAAFGRPAEGILVDQLRESGGVIGVVAEIDGELVGHVLLSPITIDTVPALALAPVAVVPARQNRKIGTALVELALSEAEREGHRIVVVIGHPSYYPRFGFVQARPHGIESPFEVRDEVFMVRALVPGALEGVRGLVVY